MAQLLVRNLSDEMVESLKRRASSHGRSVEAEHRAILETALNEERARRVGRFREKASQLREALTGRAPTNSADLIRESRDER
ncbi:FitA-like ribbon-helix-helix domain-containing protein [Brevundimonas sp.]|jgi:plasmid stability protein|uniref:FitA-like ribbon-helix-helix domain-containing protein n=1 Tax=Brevundimonas sp. TaxID=1871086 RepID=UPI0037C0956E